MTAYKHTKVVDDDVRQEIAVVLRGFGVSGSLPARGYADLVRQLGELYMRERWGVKGDMHAQVGHTHLALRAGEAELRERKELAAQTIYLAESALGQLAKLAKNPRRIARRKSAHDYLKSIVDVARGKA